MRGISLGGIAGVGVIVAGRMILAAPTTVISILSWAARNPNTVNQLGQEAVQMSTGSPAPSSATRLSPSQVEQISTSIARNVSKMNRGQMAAIAARVTECGLSQDDAVVAVQTAIVKVGRNSVAVPQANGSIVISGVQLGTNKPILIVSQAGVVTQGRATVRVAGTGPGESAYFEITDVR